MNGTWCLYSKKRTLTVGQEKILNSYGGGIDGWIPPPHQLLLVLDWPSLVTSSNCRKTGTASAASSAGNSGRPAVDGSLPAGSCWFLRWISGLPAGSLPGRSVEILLSMEIPLQPQLSDASSALYLVLQTAALYTLPACWAWLNAPRWLARWQVHVVGALKRAVASLDWKGQ
jgi:hypothetical protein